MSHILKFLRGEAKDPKGRTLMDLRLLTDEQLERSHDVIQWMFPTDVPSEHNATAPTLTESEIEIIKNDKLIQSELQLSLIRMIWFYEKNDFWVTQRNHNYLRITRILRCLWIAGRKHDYVSLQKALDDVFTSHYEIIGEETFLYWKNANNDKFMRGEEVLTKSDARELKQKLLHPITYLPGIEDDPFGGITYV